MQEYGCAGKQELYYDHFQDEGQEKMLGGEECGKYGEAPVLQREYRAYGGGQPIHSSLPFGEKNMRSIYGKNTPL